MLHNDPRPADGRVPGRFVRLESLGLLEGGGAVDGDRESAVAEKVLPAFEVGGRAVNESRVPPEPTVVD